MSIAFCKNIKPITILVLILVPSILNANAVDVLSPRQQMTSGIDAEDVECKSGFVLMIRSTNGAAACVKSPTSLKLSSVGWGNIIKSTVEASEPNKVGSNIEPVEQPESVETQGNVIEIKVKDGIGSKDR